MANARVGGRVTKAFRAVHKHASVRMQVAEQIRLAILSMQLLPGDRLIERDLCEQMSVSRPVVREALRELETVGLVDAIPHRGPMVARIRVEDASDIYAIRAELEALAGKAFVERATLRDRQALRRALGEIERAYALAEPVASLAAKERFYDILLAGGKNAVLPPLLRQIHGRITLLRAMTLAEPGRGRRSIEELRAMVNAIEDRDVELTILACRSHVLNAAETAMAILGRSESPLSFRESPAISRVPRRSVRAR